MYSKTTVKYLQSLQQKKARDADAVFVAEGPKLVEELLLQNIFEPIAIYAEAQWSMQVAKPILNRCKDKLFEVKDFELQKLSALVTPNKVVAIFKQKLPNLNPNVQGKFTLVLDDIQDPGNLGTIIRTADWFGVDNIICSMQTADAYNAKVVQSTMASIGRVNVLYADLQQFLLIQNVPILAATLGGTSLSLLPKIGEGILLIGNESKGVSQPLAKLATHQITIDRIGAAESLNAAVATGILLHHLCS